MLYPFPVENGRHGDIAVYDEDDDTIEIIKVWDYIRWGTQENKLNIRSGNYYSCKEDKLRFKVLDNKTVENIRNYGFFQVYSENIFRIGREMFWTGGGFDNEFFLQNSVVFFVFFNELEFGVKVAAPHGTEILLIFRKYARWLVSSEYFVIDIQDGTRQRRRSGVEFNLLSDMLDTKHIKNISCEIKNIVGLNEAKKYLSKEDIKKLALQ